MHIFEGDSDLSLSRPLDFPSRFWMKLSIAILSLNCLRGCSFCVFEVLFDLLLIGLILMIFVSSFSNANFLLIFLIFDLSFYRFITVFCDLFSICINLLGYLEYLICEIVSLICSEHEFNFEFYQKDFQFLLSFLNICYF